MDNNDKSSTNVQPHLCSTSFKKLNDAVEKSLQRITSKNRIKSYLEKHFKEVLSQNKDYCVQLFEDMLTELKTMIKEEFQLQLETSNVEKLLNEVDRIKVEYEQSSTRKWRPSGSPEEDIKAHLVDVHELELNKLEKILSTLESQNKMLVECVKKTDEKLTKSVEMVKEYSSTWEEAALEVSDETRSRLKECA